jgi:hypothetical protein
MRYSPLSSNSAYVAIVASTFVFGACLKVTFTLPSRSGLLIGHTVVGNPCVSTHQRALAWTLAVCQSHLLHSRLPSVLHCSHQRLCSSRRWSP